MVRVEYFALKSSPDNARPRACQTSLSSMTAYLCQASILVELGHQQISASIVGDAVRLIEQPFLPDRRGRGVDMHLGGIVVLADGGNRLAFQPQNGNTALQFGHSQFISPYRQRTWQTQPFSEYAQYLAVQIHLDQAAMTPVRA